jgi:hypothetical protein
MLGFSAALDREDAISRIKKQFLPIFMNGFYCWPLANIITFRYIPVAYRMIWINFVGLFWNTYLVSENVLM